MSGARVNVARSVALGVLLALSVLLLVASKAQAGKYAVAQCGWYVGADAGWADTTGGAKFRPDAWCVPPAGADPFAGAHLKSLTREGQGTVTGTRFARWRWTAPAGTRITMVRGTAWHALHDGMEHRLGAVTFGGGFQPFLSAATTDTAPREFTKGFPAPVAAVEDRLLCARGEDRWCSLAQTSWSSLRAVTLTLEDVSPPAAGIGGELFAGGWRRGSQSLSIWGGNQGAGIRFGETFVDGTRAALTEWDCAKASIGGEWRATRMQPCQLGPSATQAISTTTLSDGPHAVFGCVTDFSDNGGCTPTHRVLVDNNPPAHPRAVALAGGEEWRRVNDFDLGWENPDQGPASPIAGASWRVNGEAGYDTGARWRPAGTAARWRTSRSPPPAPTPCGSGCGTRPATRRPPRR